MIRRYMETGAGADWNPWDKERGRGQVGPANGRSSPRGAEGRRSRSSGGGGGGGPTRRGGGHSQSASWDYGERETTYTARGRSLSHTHVDNPDDEVDRFLRGETGDSSTSPTRPVASSSSSIPAADADAPKIPDDTLTFEDVCYLHVVKPVDSLQLIAIVYNTTPARIKDINQLRGMSSDIDCLPPSSLLVVPMDATADTLERCMGLNTRVDFLEVYGSRLPATFRNTRQKRTRDELDDAPFRPRDANRQRGSPRANGGGRAASGALDFDRMNNFDDESDDDIFVAPPHVVEGPSQTTRAISSAGKFLSKGVKGLFKSGKGLVKRAGAGGSSVPTAAPIASSGKKKAH